MDDVGGLSLERDPESGSLLLVDRWSKECVYIQSRNVLKLLEAITHAENVSARERKSRVPR